MTIYHGLFVQLNSEHAANTKYIYFFLYELPNFIVLFMRETRILKLVFSFLDSLEPRPNEGYTRLSLNVISGRIMNKLTRWNEHSSCNSGTTERNFRSLIKYHKSEPPV